MRPVSFRSDIKFFFYIFGINKKVFLFRVFYFIFFNLEKTWWTLVKLQPGILYDASSLRSQKNPNPKPPLTKRVFLRPAVMYLWNNMTSFVKFPLGTQICMSLIVCVVTRNPSKIDDQNFAFQAPLYKVPRKQRFFEFKVSLYTRRIYSLLYALFYWISGFLLS